jgi:hypothetical protein
MVPHPLERNVQSRLNLGRRSAATRRSDSIDGPRKRAGTVVADDTTATGQARTINPSITRGNAGNPV